MRCSVLLACALLANAPADVLPPEGWAERLTAEGVARLAAARAPAVLIARTGVLEAEGRLAGARALGVDNPVIEGLRGSDESPDRATEVELQVPLGFGLQRMRRIAEARADTEREAHLVADVQRRVVGLALSDFYRILHAEERKSIAEDRRDLAEQLRRVASERVRTGDAPRLELLAAETELSRAESEVLSEERSLTQTRVELAAVLGLGPGSAIEVLGDLSDRSLFDPVDSSADPGRRADVLAAESEVKAAQAAVSLAGSALIPSFSFHVSYQHSRSDDIIRPGVSVSLPVFNAGQGARREARARRERAEVELAAQRAAAASEAEGARRTYLCTVAAAQEIEERGLPCALETESLARQGYEAGKLDFPMLLVVRANALDTRRERADRLLEAALAGIDLAVAVGSVLPP